MANDIYQVDVLATAGGPTVEVTDDGTGQDWITILGDYPDGASITLAWSVLSGMPTAASGQYFSTPSLSGRLVVQGVIENVRGSLGADFIVGNVLANQILGDQTASGPGGSDTIDAGDGNDRVWGGRGDDSIGGSYGNDTIWGGLGNDTISGGSGLDLIEGGRGADSMAGGSDVGDTVSYAGSSARVAVVLTAGSATTGAGGDAAGDTIFGFTGIVGSAFDDRLEDSVKGNVLNGSNTNVFDGGAGNDRMLMGGADDVAYGGTGNDLIYGEAENDRLYGGDGADTLFGGTGTDRMTGGAGPDVFRFVSVAESPYAARDRIEDFQRGTDLIHLLSIDADAGTGGNQAFDFIGAVGFHGVAGELRAVAVSSGVVLIGDIDGDRAADFGVLVLGVGALDATDLVL